MAKSETKGLSLDDLNKMFEVTDEKKKNMASFKGKIMMKLPKIGDKKGIIVKPKLSKDDNGNLVPILQIKNDKLMSVDKTMKLLTVEDYEDQGVEYTIPYGSTLHYSFVGIVESHQWKFEDIFGKWFKITAADFKTDKAETGTGTAYRASYREDLNKQAVKPTVTKTSDEF